MDLLSLGLYIYNAAYWTQSFPSPSLNVLAMQIRPTLDDTLGAAYIGEVTLVSSCCLANTDAPMLRYRKPPRSLVGMRKLYIPNPSLSLTWNPSFLGLTTLQTYLYFTRYHDSDPTILKLAVSRSTEAEVS